MESHNDGALTRRTLFNRAARMGALATLSTPLLAGCGRGETSSGAGAAGDPVRGGVLKLAAPPSGSEKLDPFLTNGGVDDVQPNLFYERLFDFDSAGVVRPKLAESATPSGDGMTWTIELRSGVKFHDGADMTSQDVVWSFKRMLDPDLGTEAAGYFPALSPSGVSAKGAHRVELRFDEPFADLPPALAQQTVMVIRDGLTDFSQPVGTGPFTLVSWRPGERTVTERFQDYWQEGQPYLDGIEIVILDPDASIAALRARQVHAVERLDPAKAPEVESGGFNIFSSPTGGFVALVMAVDEPPFDDVRVRQAFRLMVDRQQVLENVNRGFGRIGNDLTSPDDPAYANDLPQRSRDLEEARRLLAESGNDGLSVDLYTYMPYDALGVIFARQAKDAGVTVNVQKFTDDIFFDRYFLKVPFSTIQWFGRPLAQMLPLCTGDGPYNDTHWKRKDFDAKLGDALGTVDATERAAIWGELQQELYEEGGYIIPTFDNAVAAHSPDLGGLRPDRYTYFGGYRFADLWLNGNG